MRERRVVSGQRGAVSAVAVAARACVAANVVRMRGAAGGKERAGVTAANARKDERMRLYEAAMMNRDPTRCARCAQRA